MTHERTMQTMWWAMRLVAAGAALYYILATMSGCASVTGSTEIRTPEQEAFVAYAECYATFFGLPEPTVYFTDKAKHYPCEMHTDPDKCRAETPDGFDAAAWAMVGYGKIVVYAPALPGTDQASLAWWALHEVIHLTMIWDHGDAFWRAAYRALNTAECGPKEE